MDRFRLESKGSRAAALLIVVLVGLLGLWLRLSLMRSYAIDEFAYAHGAWLISHGQIPAVDFFETKFLLPLWIFAGSFLVGGDDPNWILALRVLVWPFVAAVLVSVALLNRRVHPLAPLLTMLGLVANPVFMNTALEIRPDIVALAFFAIALALASREVDDRGWGWALGLVLGACLWSSAKAAVYASPFALVWLADVVYPRPGRSRVFQNPWSTALGGLVVVVVVFGYLVATGSTAAFYENAILHNQKFLVGERWRPWQTDVVFLIRCAPWIHVLAILGIAVEGVRLARRRSAFRSFDLLLLLLVPSTFASYALQLYPFVYSLLPFMMIEAVFAGRGFVFLWTRAGFFSGSDERTSPQASALSWLLRVLLFAIMGWGGIAIVQAGRLYYGAEAPRNTAQHALLTEIARITAPGDPIYDNSGSYVARPNAYRLPWTDEPIRRIWADQLAREVPLAIEASDCVVAIVDPRYGSLPTPLREYLDAHFRPFVGPIRLWGEDFEAPGGRVDAEFEANREGRYRVLPEEVAAEGGLIVDGLPIAEPIFELEEGIHEIHYDGSRGGFRLQWSPSTTRSP